MDFNGGEVTFDPTAPGTPARHAIDAGGNGLDAVACPSPSQCVSVDGNGGEVTFDPTAPGTPTPVPLDTGTPLEALACPSAIQCTTVAQNGGEVTFDPSAPGAPTPVSIDAGHALLAIACPAATQCTAVDVNGREVTFDPASPAGAGPARITGANTLFGVACPSVSLCVTGDSVGYGFIGSVPATPPSPPPATAALKVVSSKVVGQAVDVRLTCGGATCQGNAFMKTHEKLRSRKLVGVEARRRKAKIRLRTVTVGHRSFTLAAGKTLKLVVPLNSTGKRLLKRFHKLPVTLTVTFTTSGSPKTLVAKHLTIKAPKHHKRKHKHKKA